MQKFGLFGKKKEMTKLWVNDVHTPVTLIQIPTQEVVRYKTVEKDGYEAAVVGLGKKESSKEKGQKISYGVVAEFTVAPDFVQTYAAGTELTPALLDWVTSVSLSGYGKGKGFQWVMKRFHTKWWQKTRGSKFHRAVGSMGNRKPRRTQKGHPHAWRMGNDHVTLKNIAIVDNFVHDGQHFFAVKGSVPGSYNWIVKILVS